MQLVHIEGPLKGEIQEFLGPEILIGRTPSCHLHFPVDLTLVSSEHAAIIREGNRFRLLDRSANGTFVNGKRIKDVYLENGDVISFGEGGPKVGFLVQMPEASFEPPLDEQVVLPHKPEPEISLEAARPHSASKEGMVKATRAPGHRWGRQIRLEPKFRRASDWLGTAYQGSLRESADVMVDFYDDQGVLVRSSVIRQGKPRLVTMS